MQRRSGEGGGAGRGAGAKRGAVEAAAREGERHPGAHGRRRGPRGSRRRLCRLPGRQVTGARRPAAAWGAHLCPAMQSCAAARQDPLRRRICKVISHLYCPCRLGSGRRTLQRPLPPPLERASSVSGLVCWHRQARWGCRVLSTSGDYCAASSSPVSLKGWGAATPASDPGARTCASRPGLGAPLRPRCVPSTARGNVFDMERHTRVHHVMYYVA